MTQRMKDELMNWKDVDDKKTMSAHNFLMTNLVPAGIPVCPEPFAAWLAWLLASTGKLVEHVV